MPGFAPPGALPWGGGPEPRPPFVARLLVSAAGVLGRSLARGGVLGRAVARAAAAALGVARAAALAREVRRAAGVAEVVDGQ